MFFSLPASRFIAVLCLLLCLAAGSAVAQTGLGQQQVDSLIRVADSMKRELFVPIIDEPASAAQLDTSGLSRPRPVAAAADSPVQGATAGRRTYSGTIRDAGSGESVPFAELFIGNSRVATATLEGHFSFSVEALQGDTLFVEAMGFATHRLRLSRHRGDGQQLEISMEREVTDLAEFVFHGGEDPAEVLFRKILAHKPANNPDRLDNYRYEVYNKLELDLQHLSRKQFEKLPVPMLKQFSFVFSITDSTSEETPILPVFLTESLSDYFYQRSPKKTREFTKAIQVRGIKNESVDQYLGGMYQNLNAYANFIPVFDKRFISPISDAGLFYYKYKIKDTQEAYGLPIYLVQFQPRRPGENCFTGDFWVADSAWALQRISMQIPKEANINWVKRVNLYQEFAPIADSAWFAVKEKFVADFVVPYGDKLPGFIGRKTTSYRNIVTNNDSTLLVVNDPKYKTDVTIAENARGQDDTFWATARHDTLSKNERAIYTMIDSLERMPTFTRFKSFMRFWGSGMLRIGGFDIGPYWNAYSNNSIEGPRFRLGIATNENLFKDLRLTGYLAYGTRDQRFKYRLSGQWLLNRHPRQYLYAAYTSDVDRSTVYYDQTTNDNIFSVAVRKKGIPWKLAYVREGRIEHFKEYYSGFSHTLTVLRREFDPYEPLPTAGIFHDHEDRPSESVVSTEVGLRLRYAYKEQFVEGKFLRTSLGSRYPIIDLRIGVGLQDILGSGYAYKKVNLSISDHVNIAPLGWLYVNVYAGKYFGTLPYALLEVHPGNELYFYNRFAFNMMNRFEFISDQYAGVNLEHTIGGGLFNYVPLLKRAKLRQFWTAKALIGSLSPQNRALNLDKGYAFRTLEGMPYVELGTGIENILQIFRIDFIWRVTPRPLPTEALSRHFGIFGSMRVTF